MNIGIIVSNICSGAGTERAVINLANAISELTNNRVFIISLYSKDREKPFYEINSDVVLIHLNYKMQSNIISRLVIYKTLLFELKRCHNRYGFSVLMGTTHAYNCVISCIKGIVRIGCEHINYDACPKLFRIIRYISYKKLDHVVLLTNDDKKKYHFLGEGKPVVIPNIRSFYPQTPASLENKRIISIGRLQMQKGYDILLDFAGNLRREIPGWTIDIYGEGSMETALKRKIIEKNLVGFIEIKKPIKNIQQEIMTSSIYLMTSRNEGLPMVLLEAQACGLPIVSFDCPEGPKDVVRDGVDGYLIPVGDTDTMMEKIESLTNSNELRKKMGRNARINSNQFSKEVIVARWIKLFEKAIKRREEII